MPPQKRIYVANRAGKGGNREVEGDDGMATDTTSGWVTIITDQT